MLEEKLQQFGTKIFISVMSTGASFITDFFKNLDEHDMFSYYADVVKNDITHEGQVGIMSFDDLAEAQRVAESIKNAFQIPCLGIETKKLEAKMRVFDDGRLFDLSFAKERRGKITVFFPARFASEHLSKEAVRKAFEYYASLSTGKADFKLREEDLEFIPPGATLMDLVLANAHIDEFRAYYHIKLNDKEKEQEKEGPEEEENLEREIEDAGEESGDENKETPKEEPKPEEPILFPEDVTNGKDNKKSQKKKKAASSTHAAAIPYNEYKPYDAGSSYDGHEASYENESSYEDHHTDNEYRDTNTATEERREEVRREETRQEEARHEEVRKENVRQEEDRRKEDISSSEKEQKAHAERESVSDTHSESHTEKKTEVHIDDGGNRTDSAAQSYTYSNQREREDSHNTAQPISSSRHEENKRVGGMSTEGNLYGDSLRRKEESLNQENRREELHGAAAAYREEAHGGTNDHASGTETRKTEPTHPETMETGRKPELNGNDPRFDEIRRRYSDKLNGIRRPEDNNKDPRYESIRNGEGVRRPQDNNKDPRFDHIRQANSARTDMISEYYREVSSEDPEPKEFNPEPKKQEEKHEIGSFKYGNENPHVYQMDEAARQHIAEKSGRKLDGTDEYGTQKSYGHGRKILFDTHDTPEYAGPHGKRRAVKEAFKSKAKAFTRPIKEALEEAAIGGGSEGGSEGEKYLRNSAPVTDYLKKGFTYGVAINRAKETMHDNDMWAKALAATRGETQSDTAKSIIKKELEKAGLNENVFDGKNIVQVRQTLEEMQATKSALSLMDDKALNIWLSKDGKELPEGLREEIKKYREQIQTVKGKKQLANASIILTDAAQSTRLAIEALKEEIAKFEKEAPVLLREVTTLYELTELLKKKNYSEEFIKKIGNIPFMEMKNGDIAEVLKKHFELEKMDEKLKSIDSLQALAFEGRLKSFGQCLMSMSESQILFFLKDMGLSDEAKEALLKEGIAKIKLDPEKLSKLIKQFGGKDAEILKMFQNGLREQKAKPSSLRHLGATVSQSMLRSAFGQSEGANALWENIGYGRNTTRIASTGIKISMKISQKVFGEKAALTRGLQVAAHPVKYAGGKIAASSAGKAVANTRFARGLSKGFKTARHLAHAPGRFVGAHTRMAARGLKNVAVNGAKHVVVAVKNAATFVGSLFGAGGGAAAGTAGGGAAAAGTVAGGWIIIIAVLILIIIVAIASDKDDSGSVGNYQYTQFDADFQTEILNELQNLNDSFEEEVNRAATDRTYWSTKTGFSETDSVTHFESGAYSVYFRDDEGNELDHLDINNSKAILDMAAQYCKYANWSKPSENASEEIKLAYEQIKQYYLDYCKFLWVSTHRITLEEYRPGDENHSEDDRSGLTTDSQGICPKNGTQVWLTKDFTRESMRWDREEHVCGVDNGGAENPEGTCSPIPGDPTYSDYGENAICSHPEENRRDGWSIAHDEATGQPITRTHYICEPNDYGGHMCDNCSHHARGDDDTCDHVYHYCGEICPKTNKVFNPVENHKHTDYLWEYHCGGHMGAVVYVTIGDVSRLVNMNPAKDIDVNDLSNYPDTSNDVYDYLESAESAEGSDGETE